MENRANVLIGRWPWVGTRWKKISGLYPISPPSHTRRHICASLIQLIFSFAGEKSLTFSAPLCILPFSHLNEFEDKDMDEVQFCGGSALPSSDFNMTTRTSAQSIRASASLASKSSATYPLQRSQRPPDNPLTEESSHSSYRGPI